ncbi:uncharacterized protein LOC101846802 [Aplysia californica]|uniref:Uncharacterized protein LOC101846802 n=1 Tax=Aplysia californica TaxID=6500 RepID=A0ABM0JIM4_APLCA|nr:uncharacterized protein LOC101846802 [Aplysia californica]
MMEKVNLESKEKLNHQNPAMANSSLFSDPDCAVVENQEESDAKEAKDGEPEEPVDSESVKGIFGWETIDGTSIPYILRKGKKFVSVRIVERKLLSKYPNTFPDELGKKDPLISYFITEAEATLLNEINTAHCDYEYGRNPFTVKDLIVNLSEFGEFFKIVKKTFPADILAKISHESSEVVTSEVKPDLSEFCGWIQINNTVSPYILRMEAGAQMKMVPMHVIIYAAGLLSNSNVEGLSASVRECTMLNETCKAAGVSFTFGKNTKLLPLKEVLQRCEVQLFDLPFKNPLQYARYLDPRSGHPSSCLLRCQMSQPVPMVSSPPLPSTPVQSSVPHSKMEIMANAMASVVNPFMPGHHAMGLPSTQIGGVPRFVGPGHVPVRPGADSTMAHQKLHSPPDMPQPSEARALDMGMQNASRSFWSSMSQGPPPAHMGNGSRPSMTQKNLPLSPGPQSPLPYKPFSLPPSSLSAHVLMKSSAPSVQDFNHPIFHSSPSGSGLSSTMSNIRYPPPRIGLPQVPSLLASHSFGTNQFDSSLFQKQLADNNNSLSQPKSKRKSSQDSPLHAAESSNISTHSAHSNRSSGGQDRSVYDRRSSQSSWPATPSSSNNSVNRMNLSSRISACLVNGKSISCLQLNSGYRIGNFCLVEAVSKLYFPSVPLVEFVKVIQMVLQIQLYECTDEEEAAFVQYYNLPVKKLKCNKIVRVDDLEKYFPQLNYMFTKCVNDLSSESSTVVHHPGSHSSLGGPQKRPMNTPLGGPPMKQKLENVVQKLNHERQSYAADPASEASRPGRTSVIVIDD